MCLGYRRWDRIEGQLCQLTKLIVAATQHIRCVHLFTAVKPVGRVRRRHIFSTLYSIYIPPCNLCRLAMSALSVFRRALTTTQTSAESIAGTVVPHSTYLWLHSRTPVSAFPTRVQSPLVKNLQLKARDWDGLVNFSWSSGQSVHPSSPDLATQDLSQVHEVYHATAYSRNGLRLEIPSITLESADAVRAALSSLTSRHGDGLTTDVDKTVHLYVCTHGARDCRCGDTGGAVAQAIREELDSRRTRDKSGRWAQVRVREVAHIGGHK